MSEEPYGILEELDLLLEIAKGYGPNYLHVIPESTYRILNMLQTIPNLAFIERQDIESIEEYHQRLQQEHWVKQRTNDWDYYTEDTDKASYYDDEAEYDD